MSTVAVLQGRNLSITIENVPEPFIIKPLPGFAGERATEAFIQIAARLRAPEELTRVWQMVLDGVDESGEPIEDGPNWLRVKNTLSLHEGESVIHPAFYWQTTLGIDGVNEFIEAGEGLAGAKKVLERLILTLGISPMQTSRSSGLETLTQQLGGTPPTSTPNGGSALDRLPARKRGFMQNRRARLAAASQRGNSTD